MSTRRSFAALRFGLLSGVVTAGAASFAGAQGARWVNRYVGDPLPRYRHGLVFDAARGECVLFSGAPSPTRDTWVWDGVAWERRFPSATPSPQTGYAFAYDSLRQVAVLYGREEFGSQDPQTFEWDGANWHNRTTAHLPSNRDRSAMAFDAARGVTVLFGGHFFFAPFADTWVWNGTSWTERTPLTTTPEARSLHGMAFDAARSRVVMFGGFGTSSLLGDTWEWDGSDWTQRTPVTSPPARELHALAYDSARQRVVLYGGYEPGSGALGDTWEWDGTNWIQRFPVHSPPTLFDYALAYDSARARTVLVGGTSGAAVLTGTWEWDGNDWQKRKTGPPARQRHALAFDPVRERTVMFGGFHDPAFLDDTWEWDGVEWNEPVPSIPAPAPGDKHRLYAGRPEARIETALAFDARRKRIVMFGGQGSRSQSLDDTWEWDGEVWAERLTLQRPSARHGHAAAYDERRGRLVLFGGRENLFRPSLADTWEWDGRVWEQRFPATVPPSREDHTMVWDSARERVLLYAGQVCPPFDECSPRGDTWEWDGNDWTRAATGGPAARAYHGLAFDRNRARAFLFGGLGFAGALADEWEWNGEDWLPRSIPGSPGRQGHAIAYDARTGRVVLFGGANIESKIFADTWEYIVPCDAIAPGHPGGGLAISCASEPRIGSSLCVAFDNPAGTGVHTLFVAARPCLSSPVVLTGSAWCATGLGHLRPELTLHGSSLPALYCDNLPPDPALIGHTFCLQGAARESSACWRLTDALSVTLQP